MLLKFHLHLLCLIVGCIKFTAGETFYITPSPKLPCPEQHCLTLTQFLSHAKSNLSLNTTLYFLLGNHSLQSELVIRNISELHLQSFSDSPLKTATISCGFTAARLLIENVHLVHFNCLYFAGCNGNKIELIHQLIINSSIFHGGLQDTNGTAL